MITPAPTDNTRKIDTLTDVDSLNPLDRLDALLAHEPSDIRRLTEQILVGLSCIDTLVEATFGASSLYIVQNAALEQLLLDTTGEDMRPEQLVGSLILLNEADLIFRFTCAQKFAVADESLKQLRINSWGKSYIRGRRLMQEFSGFKDQINQAIQIEFMAHAETYRILITQLHETVIPEQAAVIGKLNRRLSLKLLS